MEVEAIRERIKQVVGHVTGIDVSELADETNLVDDLGLDSLTLLEIGVAVDYEFKLHLPDEALEGLETLQDAVDLVQERLRQKATEEDVA